MSVPLCSLWFIYTLLKVKSVSVSSFVIDDEPKCSKFDYDEKLLEKMIRLEHKNGLMIDTVKTFVADTERDITAIRQETEEMKQQVQYLNSRVNETLHGGLLENRQNTEELDGNIKYTFMHGLVDVKKFWIFAGSTLWSINRLKTKTESPILLCVICFQLFVSAVWRP